MDLKSKNIELIGIDLDGTLLNDKKELCNGARETIKRAYEKGVYVVPITGRPFSGVPQCVRDIDEIEYVISSNGAQIIEAKSEKSIYSFSISNEKSVTLIKKLRDMGCIFEPFADGRCYTDPKTFNSYIDYFKGSPVEEYITSTRFIVESIDEVFSDGEKRADEFFVSCSDKAMQSKVAKMLDGLGGLNYWFYDDKYIEITREDCDKGKALEAICRHLGIDTKNTMAFGDGDNDLFFLEKAGVAVAMENAFPSVKEKADIIAKSNNENGVCELIEQVIL